MTLDSTAAQTDENGTEEVGVVEMVQKLSDTLNTAIGEIAAVNADSKLLALNARIEAARAGTNGSAFGVVASEMQALSSRTEQIAAEMSSQTRDETNELMRLIDSTIRGTRLSDLALVNIDLIDRNLYERTCDVRWWATDGSLVDALATGGNDKTSFASKRMGVILSAYTVYYDLVLCDRNGLVIANGRPDLFSSVGMDQSEAAWFKSAMSTNSGDEWGFQTAHASRLVDSQQSLIYSCSVRTNGDMNGSILGALGIVFNWPDLSRPVLKDIPVATSEKAMTKAYIISDEGIILAARGNEPVGQPLEIPELDRIFECDKGFYVAANGDETLCVGHAKAPGFETYSTGWYSLVIQPVQKQ